jgi:spermidine synthase
MTQPWTEVATADTRDGRLALRRRGDRDWLITIDGRVLMNSVDHHSEAALGTIACRGLETKRRPRVLVGGLGMAMTLRAALDVLPASAEVAVAELNPAIVAWCRGPLAALTGGAVDDPRVTLTVEDFADALRAAAEAPGRLDAVLIDLYVGPDARTRAGDPLYGTTPCNRAFAALRPGGVFATWAEAFHESHAARLRAAGFSVAREHPARGSRRFVVYVATRS